MAFATFMKDLNANSLNEKLNVLVTKELLEGYNVAKFSYRILKKESPNDIVLTDVNNHLQNVRVLEMIPYFVWIGMEIVKDGKVYFVAIKIKEENFFDLLQNTIIDHGMLFDKNLIILFYRGQEQYITPAGPISSMYTKALEIKKSVSASNTNLATEDLIENNVYRMKNGHLGIFLGMSEVSTYNFNTVDSVDKKEVLVVAKSKKSKMEDLRKGDFRLIDSTILRKNPFIENLGENKVLDEPNKFKNQVLENKFDDEKTIGLWDKGKSLLSQNIAHYIQNMPVDSVQNNRTTLIKECIEFFELNSQKKMSTLKGQDLARAAIVKLAIMVKFKNLDYSEILNNPIEVNQELFRFFFDEDKEKTIHIPDAYSNNLNFLLKGNVKGKAINGGQDFYGYYSIKDSVLNRQKYSLSVTVEEFIKDLLTMRSKEII